MLILNMSILAEPGLIYLKRPRFAKYIIRPESSITKLKCEFKLSTETKWPTTKDRVLPSNIFALYFHELIKHLIMDDYIHGANDIITQTIITKTITRLSFYELHHQEAPLNRNSASRQHKC
jgi:hypothetical protein